MILRNSKKKWVMEEKQFFPCPSQYCHTAVLDINMADITWHFIVHLCGQRKEFTQNIEIQNCLDYNDHTLCSQFDMRGGDDY